MDLFIYSTIKIPIVQVSNEVSFPDTGFSFPKTNYDGESEGRIESYYQ
jgi:hypothetical protein